VIPVLVELSPAGPLLSQSLVDPPLDDQQGAQYLLAHLLTVAFAGSIPRSAKSLTGLELTPALVPRALSCGRSCNDLQLLL